MPKITDKSWITAVLAVILSFLLILSSIILSDWFQKNIYDLNSKILQFCDTVYENTTEYYTQAEKKISNSFKNINLDINGKEVVSSQNLPFPVFALIFIANIFTKKIEAKITVIELYKSLLEQYHNKYSMKILYILVLIVYFFSLLLFGITWYRNDVPSLLCIILNLLFLYLFGYVYNYIHKEFYRKTHVKKGV